MSAKLFHLLKSLVRSPQSVVFLLLVLGPLSVVRSPAFAEAGWDNGFYIKSADGNFKMDVGGRLQVQQATQIRRGSQVTTPGAPRTASDNFSDTFKIRRARIQTAGTIYEKLDWYSILNVGTTTTGAANVLFFAGFTYNFVPQFKVSGGMVQLPLDRMGEDSSSWYLGVEPPLTATQEDGLKDITIARNSMGLPFDLGLRIDGDIGNHFAYAVAAANGNGFQNTNANNELSYGGAVFIHVLEPVPFKQTDFANSENPQLTFNLGTGFEDDDAPDANAPMTVIRRWSWSSAVGGAFRWKGFSLNSELYYRVLRLSAATVEDTNNDRRLRDTGYYGNAGYFFIPKKLEGMLTASQLFREGADNNSNEFGGGLNYYIHDNKVKMQLDYTNVLDYDDIAGLNNATYHRFRLMFSMFM